MVGLQCSATLVQGQNACNDSRGKINYLPKTSEAVSRLKRCAARRCIVWKKNWSKQKSTSSFFPIESKSLDGNRVDIMARVSAISPQQMGFYYQTPLEK